MTIRAVVFDVDGTLIDSVDQHAQAWQEILARYGKDLDFATVRNEIGKGSDKFLETFLSEQEIARDGEEITEARKELFSQKYLPHLKPFPCVRELFEHIRSSGLRVALATSAHGNELEAYLKLTGADGLVQAEASSDDAEESKPSPDIFCAALDKLRVRAAEAVIVGDSRYDAQAAAKAGATPVGVLCGGFAEQDLRENGCVEIYRDPEDLLRRFDESIIGRSS